MVRTKILWLDAKAEKRRGRRNDSGVDSRLRQRRDKRE
jgi:hypothetical protein